MTMNPTIKEFGKALKGRIALVPIADTAHWAMIFHNKAFWLFEQEDGDLAWIIEGNKISILPNADATYGQRGELNCSKKERA